MKQNKELLLKNTIRQKTFFFARQVKTLYEQNFTIWDHFFPLLFPNDSKYLNELGHWTSGSGGKKTFNRSEQMTKIRKKLFFRVIFTQFLRKNVQIWDHFFPLLFPKDSKYLNEIGHWTSGSGEKRPLTGVNKWRKSVKNFFSASFLHNFWGKMFKFETTSFHYFSPKIPNI